MPSSWKALHGHLPVTIDPIQLAERGAHLTGVLPLKDMKRLTQGIPDSSGHVEVDLAFERGEGERVFLMRGVLRTTLRMTCQRCLEGMDLALVAEPWMLLVKSGAAHLESEDDADVLVVDKPISLSGLVEDELLLALPMVPMHAPEHCPAGPGEGRVGTARPEPARKNPFAVLGRLKKRN